MKKLKYVLTLLLAFPLLLPFCSMAADKPNVVFFLVDDMGWADSSACGSQFYKTPAMERLAKSSVRFTNAYSASPLCSPSRASIMSGQYPARHGLTTAWGHLPIDSDLPEFQKPRAASPVLLPNSKFVLELEQYTMAEAFRDAGYRTGFVGKWHLGIEPAYWPEQQGFEFTFHGAPDAGPRSYFSPYKFKEGTVTDGPEGEYLTDRATDEALNYIHNGDDRPFFLCLWHWTVHGPWQAKQELIDYYVEHPDPSGRQKSPLMAAMLQSMDESLGRLLDDLEKTGLDKNTIIVFTSDNGGVVKKNIGKEKVPATSNAPLRNGKTSIFEGGTRVPAFIRWPGVTDRGRVEEIPITGVDYYPTLVEMCGLKMKQSQVIDGLSLVPVLKGGALDRDTLFCYFPHSFGKWSPSGAWVRQGDWKLIDVFDPSRYFPASFELYNLRDDIGETDNLVDKYPERVEAMKKLLQQHYQNTDARVPIPNPGFNRIKPVASPTVRSVHGWEVSGPGTIQTTKKGALLVDARGVYASKLPNVKGALKMRVRAKTFGVAAGFVFWDGGEHKQFSADRRTRFALAADGAWHDYEIDFTAAAPLSRLRVDFGGSKKRPAEIEWIKLCSSDGSILAEWIFSEKMKEQKAELSFAPIFNDGAVLQCEMPVNVWGTADPGEAVTVLFADQSKDSVADSSGTWKVQFDAMPASSEPRKLTVSSQVSGLKFQIADVVVGEVWLATGQSNMVMPLRNSDGGDERLKMTLPEIRMVKVPRKIGLPVEREYTPEELGWKIFKPGLNNEIAAVAFYFAEQIQQATGRKVGIIQSSYGGTPCEAWTPIGALDENSKLKYLSDEIRKGVAEGRSKEECLKEVEEFHSWWLAERKWKKTRTEPRPVNPGAVAKGNPWSSKAPTVLYENMIMPLVPYTARGVIWYQGESNSGKPDEYRTLFPAMIEAWRTVWNRPDWPFFFVQLAAFDHSSQDWPGLRAAQTFTRDTVPHTGMALAIDCGEKKEIHPRAKQPVGERLARLARAQVYGEEIISRGPAFQTLEVKGGHVRVVFQGSEKGLETRDGKREVPGFELAGADGKFYPAQARIISKDTVELSCAMVRHPASVRYAWHNWIEPPVTLQNSAGLPAEPFDKEWVK